MIKNTSNLQKAYRENTTLKSLSTYSAASAGNI